MILLRVSPFDREFNSASNTTNERSNTSLEANVSKKYSNPLLTFLTSLVTSYTETLEIKQVEIPQLESNDVLVKLFACGICHSNLLMVKTDEIDKIFMTMKS